MTIYTDGSYCPSCAETYAGMVKSLSEWERTNRGRTCYRCGEELMPVEIDSGDAYATHCANHPWD